MLVRTVTPDESPPVSAGPIDEREQVTAARARLQRAAARFAKDGGTDSHAKFVARVDEHGSAQRVAQLARYDHLVSELETWPGVARDLAERVARWDA